MKKRIAIYNFFNYKNIGGGLEEVLTTLLSNIDDCYQLTIFTKYPGINEKYISHFKSYVMVKSIFNDKHGFYIKNKKTNVDKWRFKAFLRIIRNFVDLEKYVLQKHLKQINQEYDIVIDTSMNIFKNIFRNKSFKKNFKFLNWYHGDSSKLIDELRVNNISENEYVNYIDGLIFVSDNSRLSFIQQLNNIELKLKCTTLHNVINTTRIKQLSDIKLTTEQQDLCKKKYIVMVARISKGKDHVTLLYAFAKLLHKFPQYNLLLIGNKEDSYLQIEKLIKALEITNNVVCLGGVDNPYVYIKHSEVSVLSTFHEGSPIVILESILLNKAILVSDIDACLETINYGECGFSFKLNDVDDCYEKLSKIINKEYNQEQLNYAQNIFIKNFELPVFMKNFYDIIN